MDDSSLRLPVYFLLDCSVSMAGELPGLSRHMARSSGSLPGWFAEALEPFVSGDADPPQGLLGAADGNRAQIGEISFRRKRLWHMRLWIPQIGPKISEHTFSGGNAVV